MTMLAMNGHSQDLKHPTKVWQSLVKICLPPTNRDIEFWWKLTGYHLAHMVEAANYPVERQYEILLFHYHYIVPRLGAAPDADGRPKWKSLMAHDGSPFEYSWKWNDATSEPEIRYSWEAYNPGADSCLNPENHALSLSYMRDVTTVIPAVDFTWSRHFLEELEKGDRPAAAFLHAVEYHRAKEFDLKSYFMPRNSELLVGGDACTKDEWNDAITKLDPNNESHRALNEFLSNNKEGKNLVPAVLAWDNVPPSESRLKWYFVTKNTSFQALREIMTMGGLAPIPEAKLQDLRSLVTALLGLPADYPEDQKFPPAPPVGKTWLDTEDLVECFVYYFDVAPRAGRSTPAVKFYLPTRRYGPDDLTISRRLVDWMRERGRGAYGDQYLAMMEAVAEHRGLANGKGLHSYISYQFGKGDTPDIKSYFTPETYHPARFPEADGVVATK